MLDLASKITGRLTANFQYCCQSEKGKEKIAIVERQAGSKQRGGRNETTERFTPHVSC